ncbi:MAG: hypothetical protein NC120_01855 [Ruminococcus sp.]|nr:hypothetical protein [Ruminococcus sp.]
MNITCKYAIASVIALILAFAADGIVSGKFFPERDHPEYGSYDGADREDNGNYFEYSMAEGLSPEEFDALYGSRYTLYPTSEKYSDDIPQGNIVKVEWTNEYYVPESFKEEGKTVLKATYSKGKPPEGQKCDFKNLIDPEEYFANDENRYNEKGESVVSHNEFYMADGQLCTVDITSVDEEEDETGNVVFTGRKSEYISLENGGGVWGPAAYDSDVRSALSYDYNDRFALLLDDYSGDGDPDYCYRVGDLDGKFNGFYYMEIMNNEGRFNTRKHSGVKGVADSGFYVYGETADSIRLGHITRDIYFFLSENGGNIFPAAYNSRGNSVSCEDYVNHGLVFTSYWEDGRIELTAVNTETERKSCTAELTFKRLDGRVWRDTDIKLPAVQTDVNRFDKASSFFPASLEKGLYRIEINIEGVWTYTEFYVR